MEVAKSPKETLNWMIQFSLVGTLSSSSESEEDSDKLPLSLASFDFSLLFSFCGTLFVDSSAFDPFTSDDITPGEAGAGEETAGGAPESINFFFTRSSAEDPGTNEGLRVVASRPPVLTAGMLKLTGADPFSVDSLTFGVDGD